MGAERADAGRTGCYDRARSGLVFMTFHFPDQVDTNALTNDATDPKSGTAEFQDSAVRIERLAGGVGARG